MHLGDAHAALTPFRKLMKSSGCKSLSTTLFYTYIIFFQSDCTKVQGNKELCAGRHGSFQGVFDMLPSIAFKNFESNVLLMVSLFNILTSECGTVGQRQY